jgi:hypothetical protein
MVLKPVMSCYLFTMDPTSRARIGECKSDRQAKAVGSVDSDMDGP